MKQSFSNLRTPLDNPVAESFFSCLKREEFVHNYYDTIKELQHDIDEYVWQPEALDRDVPLTVYDVASEKAYYYHTDANKNVTELSHENRNVVAHYEYSPFGSLTKGTGDYASVNPFRKSSHDPIPEILLLK